MQYKLLFFLGGILLFQPALGQEADRGEARPEAAASPDAVITVLASGSRQAIDFTGKSISVFGRQEIQRVQGPDFTRLLERAPGVSLGRNGGPGSFTALRVRGAEGEQLLVLIDGVRAADPAAPGAGFDLGNLLMGNLATVDFLRGSNSTIWGSQAMGGVLAVTTGSEPGLSASAEYGAHDSVYATAAAQVGLGPAELGLQAGHFGSEGYSAAAIGQEPDGFRQTELAGRARVRLARGLSAFASARHADGRVEIDGFPAPSFALADTAEYQETRQLSGAAGLDYTGGPLDLRAAVSLADTERANYDPAFGVAPVFTTDGTSERAELRGRWRLGGGLALDFGGEREWLRFSSLFDPLRRTAITGAYAQLDYDGGPLHLAAGLRRDAHRDFGGQWSLGADAAVDLGAGWRLSASLGEGFKAPTLFQLHSDYGNPALRPERSRSYDLGIGFRGDVVRFRVTGFRRDTRGLIGFVSCFGETAGICAGRPFGTYDNVGRARAQGLELEAEVEPGDGLVLGAAYTLLDAEDRSAASATRGHALPRRPRHALTARLDWQARERLSLGADLRVVSGSFDDAANMVRMDGYEVMTLRANWDVSGHVALFGRVENAWDEHYETATGYATGARAAHIGARARF